MYEGARGRNLVENWRPAFWIFSKDVTCNGQKNMDELRNRKRNLVIEAVNSVIEAVNRLCSKVLSNHKSVFCLFLDDA